MTEKASLTYRAALPTVAVSVAETLAFAKAAARIWTDDELTELIEHVAHLQGVLLKPDGQALGLEAGELKRVGDPAFSQPFFTNRSGQFWLEGLKSGRYEIELSEGTWKSVPIVVGVDQSGVAKLGAIRVEKKQ